MARPRNVQMPGQVPAEKPVQEVGEVAAQVASQDPGEAPAAPAALEAQGLDSLVAIINAQQAALDRQQAQIEGLMAARAAPAPAVAQAEAPSVEEAQSRANKTGKGVLSTHGWVVPTIPRVPTPAHLAQRA